MTKAEIKQVVKSFVKALNWHARISYLSREKYLKEVGEEWSAMCSDPWDLGCIQGSDVRVNIDLLLVKASAIKIKMALLHEMGHESVNHYKKKITRKKSEYFAHMWALGKAYQLVCETRENPTLISAIKNQIYEWKNCPVPEYRYVHDRMLAENLI